MPVEERLDRAARALWALKQEAEAGAIEMCNEGDFETSSKLHMIAAKLHEAYGIGRTLPQVLSGGK